MKSKVFMLAVVLAFLAQPLFLRGDQDDNRVIGRYEHTGPHDHLHTVSVYLHFKGDKAGGLPGVSSGGETRFYTNVWDDLYLQVTTESIENGVAGYLFSFSKDEANQNSLAAEENKDEPTMRDVSATDFRSDDNFSPAPIHTGPATDKDPGPLRVIHYPGFDVEIRVLEFTIADAALQKKPYFDSLSCLVTVRETGSKKRPE